MIGGTKLAFRMQAQSSGRLGADCVRDPFKRSAASQAALAATTFARVAARGSSTSGAHMRLIACLSLKLASTLHENFTIAS